LETSQADGVRLHVGEGAIYSYFTLAPVPGSLPPFIEESTTAGTESGPRLTPPTFEVLLDDSW